MIKALEKYIGTGNILKEEKQEIIKYFVEKISNYYYLSDEKLVNLLKNDKNNVIKSYFLRKNLKSLRNANTMRDIICSILIESNQNYKRVGKVIYDKTKVEIASIKTISSYLNEIRKLNSNHSANNFYRGQANFEWKLMPSIFRYPKILKYENQIIEEMIRFFPNDLVDSSRIETLTKLQHYGLPTRLIDLTENPLIALYFACEDENYLTEDGRIFYFSPSVENIKFSNSNTVRILSNISRMDFNFGYSTFNTNLEQKDKFLDFIRSENLSFRDIKKPEVLQSHCFVRANFNNDRIKNQNGSFMIVGTGNINKNIELEINDNALINNKPHLLLIDSKSKENIKDELDKMGINEATVYPEIYKVTDYIKKKYENTNIF